MIEQNRKLEQQNRELMEQNRQLMEKINSFHPSVANQDASDQPAPAQTAGAATPQQAADQSSATTPSAADDKSLLPKADNGNPAIFGEFNPGRGFVVGRGEYGELDLSGYLAVRYLNQLPPDQSATDHLGRSIPVVPRNDFQFHRVMLFSQGWLIDPKFQYSTFVWTVQDTNQVAVGGCSLLQLW
ncbi:MAG: hypothetical protein JOZ43_03800 [Acidobacteriales bacterium]|nr:hypothetical protein [Terriglobales bacterium]